MTDGIRAPSTGVAGSGRARHLPFGGRTQRLGLAGTIHASGIDQKQVRGQAAREGPPTATATVGLLDGFACGAHDGFGTHNALLRLGDDVYLEVLAPDPEQRHPPHLRLFGLGAGETLALLESGPRLFHWVLRARDLPAAVAALAGAAGEHAAVLGAPTPMRRGDLRWTLTVRGDGARPPDGLPSVIDWGDSPHPCLRLPDRGVTLERLDVEAPSATIGALAAVRDPRLVLREGPRAALTARVRSRSGVMTIG